LSSGEGTFPRLVRAEHRVGEDDEAAKYGDEGDLGWLALGD
jgi:hypothetical protein